MHFVGSAAKNFALQLSVHVHFGDCSPPPWNNLKGLHRTNQSIFCFLVVMARCLWEKPGRGWVVPAYLSSSEVVGVFGFCRPSDDCFPWGGAGVSMEGLAGVILLGMDGLVWLVPLVLSAVAKPRPVPFTPALHPPNHHPARLPMHCPRTQIIPTHPTPPIFSIEQRPVSWPSRGLKHESHKTCDTPH